MLRAIQPRAVRLYRIEEQELSKAIPAGVCYYRNPITPLERVPIPSLAGHEVDARSLDIPGSYRRPVGCVCSDDDDDVTVRVLPPVLLYDASILVVAAVGQEDVGQAGPHSYKPDNVVDATRLVGRAQQSLSGLETGGRTAPFRRSIQPGERLPLADSALIVLPIPAVGAGCLPMGKDDPLLPNATGRTSLAAPTSRLAGDIRFCLILTSFTP